MIPRRLPSIASAIALIVAFAFAPTTALALQRASSPTPRAMPLPGPLFGIDAVSANDVWAIGERPNAVDPDEDIGLAEHWDGHNWSEFPTSGFGELTAGLVDVSLSQADDGFAVGSKGQRSFRDRQIVVEHWDGSKWMVQAAPDASFNDILTGVAANSPSDAWAVGSYSTGGTGRGHMLIEHWNGRKWRIADRPDLNPAQLNGVEALAKDDVWAVGTAGGRTLIMHWDGVAWSRIDSPNRGTTANTLIDVAASGPNDIWAVGEVDAGQPVSGQDSDAALGRDRVVQGRQPHSEVGRHGEGGRDALARLGLDGWYLLANRHQESRAHRAVRWWQVEPGGHRRETEPGRCGRSRRR
jgi:hypothetical protein